MTKENKQLLLIDLSARLPYKVKVCLYEKETCILMGIDGYEVYLDVDSDSFRIESIKPYLRPMSSMTEEEKAEFELLGWRVDELDNNHPWAHGSVDDTKGVDFLNSHHFDYRGLIGKGLAIAVTEENNPYA